MTTFGGISARLILMFSLLVAICLVYLNMGSTELGYARVFNALLRQGDWTDNLIVWEMRMPRMVLSLLLGSSLAVSGVLLQGLSRNDLASPSTVGVNAGAGLGIMIALVMAPVFSLKQPWLMPVAAVGGALLLTLLVFSLAYRHGTVLPSRLLLVGIAISYGASAAMLLLSLRMDFVTHNRVVSWMSGSLSSGDWRTLLWLAPSCLCFSLLALSFARSLNVLALGDEVAANLGVPVQRKRFLALALATVLTSSSAAVAGQIGFLGLVAPHLARRLVGQDHRWLFPAAAISGAALLVLADGLGRHWFSPNEMPAGVLVGALGSLYFLFLLVRTRG